MFRLTRLIPGKSLFPFSALIVAAVFAVAGWRLLVFVSERENLGEEGKNYAFEIKKGQTMRDAARALNRAGLVESEPVFIALFKLLHRDKVLKTGNYKLRGKTSFSELFTILNRGQAALVKVTIPEGFGQREIFAELSRSRMDNSKRYASAVEKVLSQFNPGGFGPVSSLEGFLFPDTYFFSESENEETVLKTMVRTFMKKVPREFYEGLKKQNLSPYEGLVLASIIEKETGNPHERKLIASVFANRLRRGMPLQSDPTVIYGLGESFNGNIRKKHLLLPTPFNTYTIPALPPTPIASPGIESMLAAAYPAKTAYLYFVAKGDGTSYFSKTLKEHNRAVARYQLRRSKNYRSTPR